MSTNIKTENTAFWIWLRAWNIIQFLDLLQLQRVQHIPSMSSVQAGFCPCNLYWIETCIRADHRQQAASVHLWELDDLVRTMTTVHSWSWRCVMTTSYVTVAVTASVVSWWPRLPVHRQSRHQVQLPSLPVASQCPAGKVSYPGPVAAGYRRFCTQIRTQWPWSPHPPLVCEEMLHRSKHGVFNKIYWGHKKHLILIRGRGFDSQISLDPSMGHNSCYRYRKCLALLIKRVIMHEFYNSDNRRIILDCHFFVVLWSIIA